MFRSFLPFVVFAAITVALAVVDFFFMRTVSVYTVIWRYPSDVGTLLGAVWFGQASAAVLTPLVLRFVFRIRQLTILLPWIILGSTIAVYLATNVSAFVTAPFDPIEAWWRITHMPMTSLQTMTFDTNRDFLARFLSLQVVLSVLLIFGYVAEGTLRLIRPKTESTN